MRFKDSLAECTKKWPSELCEKFPPFPLRGSSSRYGVHANPGTLADTRDGADIRREMRARENARDINPINPDLTDKRDRSTRLDAGWWSSAARKWSEACETAHDRACGTCRETETE